MRLIVIQIGDRIANTLFELMSASSIVRIGLHCTFRSRVQSTSGNLADAERHRTVASCGPFGNVG